MAAAAAAGFRQEAPADWRVKMDVPYMRSASQFAESCFEMAKDLMEPKYTVCWGSQVRLADNYYNRNWIDGRIFSIFNLNIEQMNGPWHSLKTVELFRLHNYEYYTHAVVLKERPSALIDLNTLERTYQRVLSFMQSNWVAVNPEDHPNLFFKEDPKNFVLFFKARRNALIQEDALIRGMALRLRRENDVKCDDEYRTPDGGYVTGNPYLWIRKSELRKVINEFGFRFL